ncbi:M14 family zinc carboxypeptidase [Novosphingobium mangrovi (ex Hu et al. 2023)]|uniref:Peptidase M14 domain-containing protein n=1 Tax=Novosphingobium mangrovi (ex Hu et al. 2023) TaxID=2930094 RepID=A0ABT0ABG9_9SPHN|nr:M14 family zinc carboxypeptidase [Novosphingobium mangrovi (ex Hu et al. 2023)]MCJ1960541.1 hypothetical protein [Novosphingobium mangrovi (ex Hu et al. 2023)]
MFRKSHVGALGALLLCSAAQIHAQAGSAPAMDSDYAAAVKSWTTKPEFMSPLVDHLPASSTIPSPKEVLGDHIGAPNKLHYYQQIVGYYRALAQAAPDRVKIVEIGKTEEGRENIIVMISSAQNMAGIENTRLGLAKLADPRGVSEEEAKAVIAETPPIYHISAGLHSAETGPPEMLMELAYRLLADDSETFQRIRDNVIVSLSPVLEADGRDRYVDWYYRNLIDERDDRNKPGGPPYWGKYIYHDNNRDINLSDKSAKELMKWYLEWHPPIMHELHESVPFLYIYSGMAPQNPDLDPLLFAELPWFSNYEMAQLTKYGMPGVWTHGYVDAWTPGYLAFMSSNHNGMLRMYETFGNGGATTMYRHVAPDPASGLGRDQTTRKWYRPNPPYKEVMWSLRNNTNFMETGVLTALDMTSRFPKEILENFYKKSRDAIKVGAGEAPYGFIIPAGQADPTRVKFVTDILQLQGIEIGQAEREVKLKEGTYPAGSLIVKLDQPYGRLAKILLRVQDNYPDENVGTYDDAAWTMGLMAHARIVESADEEILSVPTRAVDSFAPRGSITGSGAKTYAVLDTGAVGMATLRYKLADVDGVEIVEDAFKSGGTTIPAGSFLVPGSAYDTLKPLVETLALDAVGIGSAADKAQTHASELPRLGVFSTWGSTQDVGWLRYGLDQQEIDYDLLFKERVRQGNLRADYDIIILPQQGRSTKDIVFDIPMTGKPLPYTKTDQYRFSGDYGSSPDIRGGMGLEGLAELKKFVDAGGTLITTGRASEVPIEYGFVSEIATKAPPANFYAPGPIVKGKVVKPQSPIFYGYAGELKGGKVQGGELAQGELPLRWAQSTTYYVPERLKADVLMTYPGGKDSILSGFIRDGDKLKDNAAIINVPSGEGRILMFATNPVWRWQNWGEFRMLYNAVLNWKQLGATDETPPPPPAVPAAQQ